MSLRRLWSVIALFSLVAVDLNAGGMFLILPPLHVVEVVEACGSRHNECDDGKDNDGDGAIDYPADFGCSSESDDDESDREADCQDSEDNDGDGKTDYPNDPGCDSPQDNNEYNPALTECSDGKDNDNDGKIDALRELDSNNGETRSWVGDNKGIRSFVNQKAAEFGFTPIPTEYSGQGMVSDDSTTANKVCELAGFSTVAYKDCHKDGPGEGRCNFSSCRDNVHGVWNTGRNDFDLNNACETQYLSSLTCKHSLPACDDGIDNDNDGGTDYPDDDGCASKRDDSEIPHDPECDDPDDDSERDPECSDGQDNDGDGATDYPDDFSCLSPDDDDESSPEADCQDSDDNDGDTYTDYPLDPGCYSPQDPSEHDANGPECDNGEDDDGDGDIDYPDDSGCDSPVDDTERDYECSDGEDNDNDGATDYPDDFSCDSPDDDDESDPLAQCQDSADNDNDGETDYSDDPGCYSLQDDDERDSNGPECDNGLDDDGDGEIDYPNDPECDGPDDDSEQAEADLKLKSKIGPSEAELGETIEYEIKAKNLGPDKATNVVVSDVVPTGFTFNSTQSDPSCILNGNSVLCNNFDLNSGQSKTFTVAFDVVSDNICDTTVTNTATVSASSTDNNPGNNSKSATTDISCPVPPECSDGIDNDQDGAIDYPDDFSCDSPDDDDESDPLAQCQDSVDNDNDGETDYSDDPGCYSSQDDDERDPNGPECDNGEDDDGDGYIDYPQDPGCDDPWDDDESEPECSDGEDNDGDGATDWPDDFSCSGPDDDDEEYPKADCQDSDDNDGDGETDYPNDPGCYSYQDPDEKDPNGPECDNGIDDDQDGETDYPDDPGCDDPWDDDESEPECSDGEDNDGDGATDYPDDFSCDSPDDDDESSPEAQCQDGYDNDQDGYTDYPQDPGCDSYQDDDEFHVFEADLTVTKNGPSYVYRGGTVSYTLRATNYGPDTAENVVVEDEIPAELSFNALASDPNCIENNGDVLCNNISLSNGATRQYTVVFDVLPNVDCDDVIENRATVSTSSTDPNSSNNQSQEIDTNVLCYECSDDEDNDGDGATDYPDDFSCSSPTDDDESHPLAACQDGWDNDADGLIDYPDDPGCSSEQDDSERDPNGPECDNGFDDDHDGWYDYPDDPGCDDPFDDSERETECSDGFDNDGDGAIDYPNDFSCSSPSDDDESNPEAQCQDGVDNDHDGYTDYPQDPGCDSYQDDDEFNEFYSDLGVTKSGPSSASRGNTIQYTVTATNYGPHRTDNVVVSDEIPFDLTFNASASDSDCVKQGSSILCDNISLVSGASHTYTIAFDVDSDAVCNNFVENDASVSTSSTDPNPFNNTSQQVVTFITCAECSDGIDNDQDGATDYPDDFSCSSPYDDDESSPLAQCQDGIDNDQDGYTDFPNDPGCDSLQDDDEFNVLYADLSVVKSGVVSIHRGSTLLYTVTATNHGPDTAKNVVVGDWIPSGLTFNPAFSDVDCVLDGAKVLCDNLDLANGQPRTYQIAFDVPETYTCDAVIQNSVHVSTSSTDPNSHNNVFGPISTTVTCVECNDGVDNDSDGAIDYPDDFSCSSKHDDDEAYPMAKCQDGIDNDQDGYTDYPQDPGCDSLQDDDETNAPLGADLSIIKSGPVTIQHGQTAFYSLNVLNNGPEVATNVVAADPVPNGMAFNPSLSDPACILQAGDVLCNNLNLANGSSKSYIVAFDVTGASCGASVLNSTTVSASSTDPNSGNNASSVLTTVQCTECNDGVDNDFDGAIDYPDDFSCDSPTDDDESSPLAQCQDGIDNDQDGYIDYPQDPGCDSYQDNDEFHTFVSDLSITKTGPATVVQGTTVSYTLIVTNNGPDTAENVVSGDTIPTGLTFNASASSVDCTQQGADVLCDNLSLANGASRAYTVAFDVPVTVACDSIIQNVAFASTSSTDPNSANNQSQTVTTTVMCTPTECSDGIDNDQDGAIDYPADFSCTSPDDDDESSPLAQCQDGLDNDQDGYIDYPADPGCTSPQDNDEVHALTADLSITKSGPATVQRGSILTYGIIVINNGPDDAQNVVISDTIPAGLSFNTQVSSSFCLQQGSDILCTRPTVPNNTSEGFNIAFNVPQTAACDSVILNAASVSASSTDPDSSNNQSNTVQTTVECPVIDEPTFNITKTDNKTTVQAGETFSYTITVTNTSTVNATDVNVTDSLPTNTSFITASDSGTHSNGVVTWSGLSIAAGATKTLTLTIRVNDSTADNTVLTNYAFVEGIQATDTTTVQGGGTGTGTQLTLTLNDSQDPVEPCETYNYIVRITNLSSTQATDVDAVLSLDGDTDFLSASNSGNHNNGVVTWNNLTIPGNNTTSLTVTVKADCSAEDDEILRATAIVNDLTDSEDTRVDDGGSTSDGDVTIDITDDTPDPVDIGEVLTYNIRVCNEDNDDTEVDVTAFLDNDTSFLSASDGGDEEDDDEVQWDNIDLNDDSCETLVLRVRVRTSAEEDSTLRLRARVGDEDDTEHTRVIGGIIPPPPPPPFGGPATLNVDKSADRREVQPGSIVTYTVTIRNTSLYTASDIKVEDSYTAGSFAVEDAAGGNVLGNTINWNIPALGPNATRVIRYRVRIAQTMRHGQMISNSVVVHSPDLSGSPSDVENINVIEHLPQTGISGFLGALGDTDSTIRPHARGADGNPYSLPLLIWTNIIAIGMSGGWLFGRKLFFY